MTQRPRDPTSRPAIDARSFDFPPEWETLTKEIQTCERCPLHRTRTQVVVYRGGPRPRVLFVGEAPGAEEDRSGLPFVGRSGARLDEAIARIGLAAGEFGVLNLLKCRPPANRFDPRAAPTCRPFLDRQLAILRPTLIVTLGAHALAALDPRAPRVLRAAGRVRDLGEFRLFPLLHPAATLRATRHRVRWDRDVGRLRRMLAAPTGPNKGI